MDPLIKSQLLAILIRSRSQRVEYVSHFEEINRITWKDGPPIYPLRRSQSFGTPQVVV